MLFQHSNFATASKVALSLLGLTIATVVSVRTFLSADPDGGLDALTTWVCTDPICKAEFRITRSSVIELTAASSDNAVPCATCGKSSAVRAVECSRCKRLNGLLMMGRVPARCGHCGKFLNAITDLADQTICNPISEPAGDAGTSPDVNPASVNGSPAAGGRTTP